MIQESLLNTSIYTVNSADGCCRVHARVLHAFHSIRNDYYGELLTSKLTELHKNMIRNSYEIATVAQETFSSAAYLAQRA